MPKLNYPKITRGNAITALLNLYREEPSFMKELDEIRQPYMPILEKFARDSLSFIKEHNLSPSKYYQDTIDWYKGKIQQDPFPTEEFQYLSQAQLYFDGLAKLAERWKLRAHWAVMALFSMDLTDCLKGMGMPDEIDIPISDLGDIYPWPPPLPPLDITVPAWFFFISGREAIQTEIAGMLHDYEAGIKAQGLGEYPSAIEIHAQLWFEHYVYGKTYTQLEKK
ncbi:hypothetical protein ACFLX3_02850 [Chloroflexota bacterium]